MMGWNVHDAARQFAGALSQTTLNLSTSLKIFFQRRPGLDANSGIEHAAAIKTVRYKFTVAGTVVVDKDIGPAGLVAVPLGPGRTGTLEVFDTQYTIHGHNRFEALTTVRGAQRRLNALGYELGGVDGAVGPLTDRSTLNFQADHGPLDPDGIFGPLTRGSSAPPDGLKQNVDDKPK